MADNTEKVISVRVDGIERALVSFEAIEAETKRIKDYLQETGRTLPDKQIKALAKSFAEAKNAAAQLKNEVKAAGTEIDKNNTKAKSLGRNLKEAFKSIGSDAIGGGGVSGLIGGLLGDGLFSLLEKGVTALLDWVFAAEEASAASESLTSSTESLTQGYAEEKVQLDSLFAPLFDVNLGTEERSRLIDEIESKYGAYIGDIDLERATQEQLAEAYRNVNNAIIDNLIQKTKAKNLEEQFNLIAQKQILIEKERQRLLNIDFPGAPIDQQTTLRFQAIENSKVIKTLTKDIDDLTKSFNENAEAIDAAGQALKNIGLDFGSISVSGSAAQKTASDNAAKLVDDTKKAREASLKESLQFLKEMQDESVRLSQEGSAAELAANEARVASIAEVIKARIEEIKVAETYSGFSEDELKKEILFAEGRKQVLDEQLALEEQAAFDLFKTFNTINNAGDTLIENTLNLSKDKFKSIIQGIFDVSKSASEFRQKAEEAGFLFPKASPIAKESDDVTRFINVYKADLKQLEEQAKASGVSIGEINNILNEGKTQIADNIVSRQEALDKTLGDYVLANLKENADLLNQLGISNVETLQATGLALITAEKEKAFKKIGEEISPILTEVSNVLGKDFAKGVSEGFIEFSEKGLQSAIESGLINPQTAATFKKAVEQANLQFKKQNELEAKRNKDAAQFAITQALANFEKANEVELGLQKVNSAEIKTEVESSYEERLALDRKYVADKKRLGEKLSDLEIAEIVKNRNDALNANKLKYDAEIKAETTARLSVLGTIKQDSKARELLLRQTNLRIKQLRLEEAKEALKIEKDRNDLLEQEDEKNAESRSQRTKRILNEITSLTQQIAQAIDNIFQIIINKQQELVNNIQERLSQVDQQLQDSLSKISELEADLEGKRSGRREAILRGIEAEREAETRLTAQKIELANRLAREEEKLAKKRKAFAISQALINGALASMNIWANNTIPYPAALAFNIPMQASIAALTATQVALIASQKFAEGGFTSDGQGGKRDDTGHIPVGIVHNDEYVIPRWMVKSPKYRPVIDSLEGARKRGFAEGGYTSPDFAALSDSVSPNSANRVYSLVQRSVDAAIALSERPIIANPVEFTNVERTVARRVNATTIGG